MWRDEAEAEGGARAKGRARGRALAMAAAPKVAAIGVALAIWWLVAASGVRPVWVLPGPERVLPRLWAELAGGDAIASAGITLGRALVGFAIAIAAGTALGVLMTVSRGLRSALLSLLAGLQTMPSVAWFPLAILIFQLSEAAILFVVVLGAAPSIAVALVSGVDQVPPILVRAGQSLGARGLTLYRRVILPAILPSFVGGLKQGWAFAWRSLMAGELLVIIGHRPSLGVRLHYARELSDAEGLLAWMLVVLAVGVMVDALGFGVLQRRLLAGRGLGGEAGRG